MAALGQSREEVEHAVHIRLELAPVLPLERTHLEVLGHRHAREELSPLRRLRDAELHDLMRRIVRDVPSAKRDGSAARMIEPVDRAQRRRLAGAVRADQGHDLALVDVEGDSLQRLNGAVERLDVLDLEQRRFIRVHELTAALPR